MKIKILTLLDRIKEADSKISIDRIEKLINLKSSDRLIGRELIMYLQNMVEEGLIISDENYWFYSITKKGINYLNAY